MSARILNQKNWIETIDAGRLTEIETSAQGPRHCPINHGNALTMWRDLIGGSNLQIVNERGLLSQDNMKFILTSDVVDAKFEDFTFTIGWINYNNRMKAFTGFAGEKVFVCSNEMVSCQIYDSRRKHTTNVLDILKEKMTNIIEKFKSFRDERIVQIETMKTIPFADAQLGKLVLKLHREGNIGNTDIDRIIAEYDTPSHDCFAPRTAWSMQNHLTEVAKKIDDPCRRILFTNQSHGFIHEIIDVKAEVAA